MIEIAESVSQHNGMTIHVIPTKKFKTISIVVKAKAPLNRETVTKRALLSYLLEKGTNTYRSEKQLMLKLNELYGATFYIDCAKRGNHHIMSFRLEIANEKFIKDESSIIDEALQLLKEIIYEPYIENDGFPEHVVTREKATLRNKINSIVDDKIAFAQMRLIDEMCKDEVYSTHTHGYEEDLSELNGQTMYDYYKNDLLQHDQFDVYVVGDVEPAEMEQKITTQFASFTSAKQDNIQSFTDNKQIEKPNEVIEKQPIQQAKLHIGYRTNSTYKDEDYYALQLFNGLLGGFPNSKLFENVREKHSLAYYAASRVESHKGLLLVFCGIEAAKYEKARDIIEVQMDDMKKGSFTDEEVNEMKDLITSQIKETLDSAQGTIELLYQQVVAGHTRTPQQFLDGINHVTKEDIIKVGEKIQLDTVYLLTEESGDQHE